MGALNSNWLPDRRLFAETADWISDRLPWWLRFAPLLACALMIALGIGMKWIRMPIPRAIPVAVRDLGADEVSSRLVLSAPFSMDLPAVGTRSILRVVSARGESVARVTGRIESVAPAPGVVEIILSVDGDGPGEGSGTLLVPNGSETLWNIFMRKLQAKESRL